MCATVFYHDLGVSPLVQLWLNVEVHIFLALSYNLYTHCRS